MRKTAKILAALLVVFTVAIVFAIGAFAQTVENPAASVYSDAEATELVGSYATVSEAIAAATEEQFVVIHVSGALELDPNVAYTEKTVKVKLEDGSALTSANNIATVGEITDGYYPVDVMQVGYSITLSGVTTYYSTAGCVKTEDGVASNGIFTEMRANVSKNMTLVLYDDVIVDSGSGMRTGKVNGSSGNTDYFSLASTITWKIDLNGYTMDLTSNNGYSNKFLLGAKTGYGAVLQIYSSREGGLMLSTTSITSLCRFNQAQQCTIIIGDGVPEHKGYTTLSGTALVTTQAAASTNESYMNQKHSTVTVQGANFYASGKNLVTGAPGKTVINIKDSSINVGNDLFTHPASGASAYITIERSTIVAKYLSSTYANTHGSTQNILDAGVKIVDSTIVARIHPTAVDTTVDESLLGQIIIEGNNRFCMTDSLFNDRIEIADGLYVVANPNSNEEISYVDGNGETVTKSYAFTFRTSTVNEGYQVSVTDGKINVYLDQSLDFVYALNEMDTENVTVTLLKDATVNKTDRTAVKVNNVYPYVHPTVKNISLDMAGYDITVKNEGSFNCLFLVADGATFNLYSSDSDSVLVSNSYVFRIAKEGATVNIGREGDPKGENANLSVNCGNLIETAEHTGHTGENPNVVNINGGNYRRTVGTTYALICPRTHVVINVNNAVLTSALTSAARIFAGDDRYDSKLTITVKDSIVFSSESNGVISYFTEGSTIVYDNCIVRSRAFTISTSNSYWGNYYRVQTGVDSEGNKVYAYFLEDPTEAVKADENAQYTSVSHNFYAAISIKNIYQNYDAYLAGDTCYTQKDTPTGKGKFIFTGGTLIDTDAENMNSSAILTGEGETILAAAGKVSWSYYSTENEPVTTSTECKFGVVKSSDIPKNMKVNISTNNGFFINFYISENSGMAIVDGASLNGQTTVGGVVYNAYTTSAISPASTDAASVSYTFKSASNGAITYTASASISLLDYFETALANAEAAANDLEKSLIVNAANYCNKVYKYATGAEYEAYTAIVAKAEEGMIVTDFGDTIRNVTEGQTAIEEAAIVVADGNIPMFAFKVKGEQVDVYATYEGLAGKSDPILCSAVEATDFNGNTATYYVIPDMKIYDMKAPITLSLDAEGNSVILEYNLAAYIASEAGQTVEVDEALYSFAVASYNYKTTE